MSVQVFINHLDNTFETCLAERLISPQQKQKEHEERSVVENEEDNIDMFNLETVESGEEGDRVALESPKTCSTWDNVTSHSYQITGTVKKETTMYGNNQSIAIGGSLSNAILSRVSKVPHNHHKKMKQALQKSNIIIYRLIDHSDVEEALYALKILETSSIVKPQTFILVSSVITWAKTTKFYNNDNTMNGNEKQEGNVSHLTGYYEPYHEDAAITRRCHDKYAKFLELEKIVRKANNPRSLETFVVCSGILYGEGEEFLHQFFKMSWMSNNEPLPCLLDGNNILPMIHVQDLVSVVKYIIERSVKSPSNELNNNSSDDQARKESNNNELQRYIVATDDSHNTLKQVIESIGKVYENKVESLTYVSSSEEPSETTESERHGSTMLFTRRLHIQWYIKIQYKPLIISYKTQWIRFLCCSDIFSGV